MKLKDKVSQQCYDAILEEFGDFEYQNGKHETFDIMKVKVVQGTKTTN